MTIRNAVFFFAIGLSLFMSVGVYRMASDAQNQYNESRFEVYNRLREVREVREVREAREVSEVSDNEVVILDQTLALGNLVSESLDTDSIETDGLEDSIEIEVKDNPHMTFISQNSDYVGWITINDTKVDYPIVKGQNNDYYLKQNFDKDYDERGSIYMDYRNIGQGLDKHTIVYGHNMKDKTMFGDLSYYMDKTFLDEHPVIIIEDLYKTRTYEIFSVYYAEADGSLLELAFDEAGYYDYINSLLSRSMVDVAEMNATDYNSNSLLTLITCGYEVEDGRYFVHAIEVDK